MPSFTRNRGAWAEGARRRFHRSTAIATGSIATCLALAGCGSSHLAASIPAASNHLTITATPGGYTVSGRLRPGAATITFSDHDSVTHSMNALRIKSGVTTQQVLAVLNQGGNPDANVAPLTADGLGPAADTGLPGMVGPGQTETVTAADLPAGTYVVADFLAGADSQPFYTHGYIGQFDVTGRAFTATPANTTALGLGDKSIDVPNPFPGNGIYLVTNHGVGENSFAVFRLDPGTTPLGYLRYVSQRKGHTSIDGGGGTFVATLTPLRPGQSAYLHLDLPAGTYGYLEPPQEGARSGPPPTGTFTVS